MKGRVNGMFKPKIMGILVCIILLLVVITYTVVRFEENSDDDTVTFYELFTDFDTSKMDFPSYEPGETVTVRDKISKMEIRENVSTVHNGMDYEYSVNIWLDSMKKLPEYYEHPTLSVIGDYNKSAMQSDFQVGDDITIHFTVTSTIPKSTSSKLTRNDEIYNDLYVGMKITDIYGSMNENRTKVEEIRMEVRLTAGSPDYDVNHDVMIEISWEDNEPTGKKSGKTTLFYYNNTEYYLERMEFKEIENIPGAYIRETILNKMREMIPIDVFRYDTFRDMGEETTSIGILTMGDIINITFNFSQFRDPPTCGGLNPGSSVWVKIVPMYEFPIFEEFTLPGVFPKKGEWIQL